MSELRIPGLENLSGRERSLVLGLGGVVLLMVLWTAGVRFARHLEDLTNRVERGSERVAQLQALAREYDGLQRTRDDLIAQPAPSSVAQSTERLAARVGVSESISSIRNRPAPPGHPQFRETSVEIQLKEVKLLPLVEFLVAVRNHDELLQVRRLTADARGEEGSRTMEASLLLSTFEQRR